MCRRGVTIGAVATRATRTAVGEARRCVGRRASEMLPPFEMFDLSIVTMRSERNSSFGIHGTDRSPRVVNDKLFYIAAEDRPGPVLVIRFRSERRID